jgi:hypothetical protein
MWCHQRLILIIVLMSTKQATSHSPKCLSDMPSEETGDHNDHDHYADDVETIHCLASRVPPRLHNRQRSLLSL